MKYILSLSLLCLFACSPPAKKAKVIQVKNVSSRIIDTSKYAIIKYDSKKYEYLFNKTFKPTDVSYDDILAIEKIIDKKVAEYNKKSKEESDSINKKWDKKKFPNAVDFSNSINNPEKYYKQLIAVMNAKGEKEVWVDCFCDIGEKSYWKKDLVIVEDGGSCFFRLKINLTTNTVIEFFVNGVA